jgi:RNA polymerase sigma-70 factor (ECF subfamily)
MVSEIFRNDMDVNEAVKAIYTDKNNYFGIFSRICPERGFQDFEDLFQDFATRVFKRYHLHDKNLSIGAWLKTVFVNLARDKYSQRKHEVKLSGDLSFVEDNKIPGPVKIVLNNERSSVLNDAVQGLGNTYGPVVKDYYLDGLSLEQVAQKEGIPLGTVKSRIFTKGKGLRKLRENKLVRDVA